METTAITVRIDEQLLAGLDEIVAYMARSSAHLALKPTRSDAIRLCITGWLVDHRKTLVDHRKTLVELAGQD